MLGKDEDKILTNIKKKYLNLNGFIKFNKNDREKINKLFYPKNKENPYWYELKKYISIKNEEIKKILVKNLYCINVNYDIYEYNGINLVKLNNINISNITFEEYEYYYYDKNGNLREAAKLFYRLVVNKKIYKVEIRWKGNIINASPQFQIHEV